MLRIKHVMARQLIRYLPVEGTEGIQWDDNEKTGQPIVGVRSVRVCHGEHVNCIQATYLLADNSVHSSPTRGDDSAETESSFTLESDEAIVRVEGKLSGLRVGQVSFTTKTEKGEEKTHGPYGKTGEVGFGVEGYIVSFLGHIDVTLTSLGVYYLSPVLRSTEVGMCKGTPFEDPVWTLPVMRIKSVSVKHDSRVKAVQCTYDLLGGRQLTCSKHGRSDGDGLQSSAVELEDGETIVELKGRTDGTLIGQLMFVTKKKGGNGDKHYHGPFGTAGDTEFSVQINGGVISLFGFSGDWIEGIGAYYV